MLIKRILVIDDEVDIREIARICLEISKGWEVLLADCGYKGVDTAAAMQPDVVLLDLMMPEIDGFTTLKNLKQNPDTKDIPVILLTANVLENNRELIESGAKGVLIKPFDPLMLAEQIEEVLQE